MVVIVRLILLELGEEGGKRVLWLGCLTVDSLTITTLVDSCLGDGAEEFSAHTIGQFIFHRRWIKYAHAVGHADEDKLRDVDLHEDENLMEGSENVADR